MRKKKENVIKMTDNNLEIGNEQVNIAKSD